MAIFSTPDPKRERWEQLAQIVTIGLENLRKIGRALAEIRDKELYKFEYVTFEQCCETRWKITVRHANRIIAANTTLELLGPMGPEVEHERHIRPLTTLTPAAQVDAWTEAKNNGGTAEAIKDAVAKRRRKNSTKRKLKPIRLRVPGGWVIVQPNKKFSGLRETLEFALRMIEDQQREAA